MQAIDGELRRCLAAVLSPDAAARPLEAITLPSRRDPRAVLPIDDSRLAARVLRDRFGGGGVVRRASTGLLAMLVTVNVARWIPSIHLGKLPEPPDPEFNQWLRRNLSEPPRISLILLGPARANRKPVVLVSDLRGELRAVAKLGYNDVTRPLVRHEAVALKTVAASLGERMHVPNLLSAATFGDVEALLMTRLPELSDGRSLPRSQLIDVVRAVSGVLPGRRTELETVLSNPRLRRLADAVASVSRETRGVPHGSVHGDLHPGNIGLAADGKPVLWDWERWSSGHPVGFDLLHHDLQAWLTVDRADPLSAARKLILSAPEILAPLGVDSEYAPGLASDYLIRLASRYVSDAQDKAGSQLGKVEDWVFPAVLERHNPERL